MTVAASTTKRLPLRAYVENGREDELRAAWSKGEPFFPWDRPERVYEKPIESMTLDELIATQNNEPLSESRRSFLATGIGMLSLNIRQLFGDEGDSVELIEIVADDPNRDDQMYCGTAYIAPDPSQRERILKEQQYAYSSGGIPIRFGQSADGSLTIEHKSQSRWDQFRSRDSMMAFAKGIIEYFGRPKTLDELHARIDLMNDALDHDPGTAYRNAYAPEERWRFEAQADNEWHSAYEAFGPAEDHLPGDPHVFLGTHFRRPKAHFDPIYDTWHNHGRDLVDSELGTHLMSDAQLEELLGWNEWDADGNPIVPEH